VQILRITIPALVVATILSSASMARAQIIGFGGSGMTGWTANNSSGTPASVTGIGDLNDVLTLTTADNGVNNSYFANTPQPITSQGWTSSFLYTFTGTTNAPADGITMTLQNDPRGAGALGGGGGNLGYGGGFSTTPVNGTNGIIKSESIHLNLYTGDGGRGLGQFVDAGTTSAGGPAHVDTTPVDLGGAPVQVLLSYDGAATLSETLTQGNVSFVTSVNLSSYQQVLGGGNSFYVGFTGATGGLNAGQQISQFQFTPKGAQVAKSLNIFQPGDVVVGVNTSPAGAANSPGAEQALNTVDSSATSKYLNFNKLNAGIVETPAVGLTVATELGLTAANDSPERDPSSFEVWGTNDTNLNDISPANNPSWKNFYTLIASGAVAPFSGRFAEQDISFANSNAYRSYLVDFPTVVDPNGTANSMQIANIQLSGSAAVPEPGTMALLAIGGLGLILARLRRRR
jgi:hypothetical protein